MPESEADASPPVSATATTLESLIDMAESGAGITCLPDFATERQVRDGTVVTILDEHLDHSNIFRAVWPSSRQLAPKVRVFVDYLAENIFRSRRPRLKIDARSLPR